MNLRMKVYLVLLFVLMGFITAWSVGNLLAARSAAEAAAKNLGDCRRFEQQIMRLRSRPALAAERERLATEIVGPIDKAARDAGIPAERLVRISPEAAQRVCETAYKEKPTRVFMRNVTLQRVTAMAHGLTAAEGGLNLKSLRLTAQSREASSGTWSAELVFSYLIYEPQAGRP
jgi:hypothetical protein